ncbi:hypothetical protein RO3G_06501 [Rhizopus delemar RA 99-880]|uniref:Uncharacterized protein n=1 Tax=Rhizopus delemar (strain RA 99-880 / ATCC MYA-4621 / FGSC 9543 / NRRL 43880) TaxID=246409 RepID=I1C016_RHIO9|nr:hypothetical protein RO3G_06501 [Rhizopus delemar RA 99-880]|eukprot:EIE81796.1 hypothetical protein RO3G_06501 [Rhizopus delemar RA 99-880]
MYNCSSYLLNLVDGTIARFERGIFVVSDSDGGVKVWACHQETIQGAILRIRFVLFLLLVTKVLDQVLPLVDNNLEILCRLWNLDLVAGIVS